MAKKSKKKTGSTAGKVVWRLLFVTALCVLVYSAWNLVSIFLSYKEGTDEYDELRQFTAVVTQEPQTPSGEPKQENGEDPPEEQEPVSAPLTVDFASLQAINPDVKGWLYIEAPEISYPMVQGADNDEYLHTTYEGKSNYAGSIFLDYQNQGDFSDCNTIIYGHNMKNQSMFGKLKQFKEQEKYKDSVYFWILTPEGDYRYQIFSAYYTDAVSDAYTLFSDPDQAFLDYQANMAAKSQVPLEVPAMDTNSRIVTLSTCAARDSSQRFVVQGVRVQ